MQRIWAATAGLGMMLWAGVANAATINFETDAVDGAAIGSTYSDLGVVFSNATWTDTANATSGDFAVTTGAGGANAPIVMSFASGITGATLTALNLGLDGARVEAYDALSGGNLVASDEGFGVINLLGLGTDIALTVANPSIFRLEFMTATGLALAGLELDDFSFDPIPAAVPVPGAGVLLISALGAMGILRRRQRLKLA